MNEKPLLPKTSNGDGLTRPYKGRSIHSIVGDLCAILQQQVDALAEDSLDEFTNAELVAYRQRQEKILDLRRELGDFSVWARHNYPAGSGLD